MKRFILALCGLLALTSNPVSALTITSSPGAALPDNTPSGVTDVINTSGFFNPTDVVTGVFIEITMTHTWVGDLAIELTSPTGNELQILARPGANQADEDQQAPYGNPANLIAANPITFRDGAFPSAETLGDGLGSAVDIPSATFSPDANGWATDHASFADFHGELVSGNWTLKVGDYAGGDLGTLVSWSLIIVPEPTTSLLLALGLVGLAFVGRPRPPRAA